MAFLDNLKMTEELCHLLVKFWLLLQTNIDSLVNQTAANGGDLLL